MPARISDVSLDGINRQLGLLDTRLTEVAEQFDALRRGALAFSGDVDLGGNRLTNTDAAQSDDDALTLGELLERLDDLEDEGSQLETSAAEDYAGGGRQKRLLRRTSRLKDQISDEVANIISALGFPGVVFTQDDGAGNAELAVDTANFVWDDANNRLGIGTNVPAQELHVVGDAIITGILYGGTAAGDHLDLDPSTATNYTGRVRIGTTASDFGTTDAIALDIYPSGVTHSTAGRTTAILFNSNITNTGNSGAFVELFRDEHTGGGASAAVTSYGETRSFISGPTLLNAFAVAATGHTYRGFFARPLWSNTGGGTLAVSSGQSYRSEPQTISTGITVSEYQHFFANDAVLAGGTLNNHIAYDTNVATVSGGGTLVSFRSQSAAATMRHAGSARFGATSTPTAVVHASGTGDIVRATDGTNNLFEVLQLETVVNNAGIATHDFRVEGDTRTHLVFVDASADRVSIGDSTPDNYFTVGLTSQFAVGTDGDLDRIKDVPYSWPAANAAGALNNDGAGNLSWAAPAPAAHNLLSASHGDTVTNTVTRGSLIYGNTTPAWDELVIGAANRVLRSDGTDVAWAQVVLTTDVTGTLPVGNGGTGNTAFTAGSVIFSNGTILTQDNAELFWDNTNDFLGIGTATPSEELHVVGDALFTGTVYGGASASDDLVLESTSNATKGFIDLQDRARIGTNVTATASTTTRILDYNESLALSGLTAEWNALAIRGSWTSANATLTGHAAVRMTPTITPSNTVGPALFLLSDEVVHAVTVASSTWSHIALNIAPSYTISGAGTFVANNPSVTGMLFTPVIGAGITTGGITGITIANLGSTGTVDTYVGMNIADIGADAAANGARSLVSAGTAVQMRHAGPAVFGQNAVPAIATEILRVHQPTAGSHVARFETAATNDDPVIWIEQGRVATTNATTTTLMSITLNASNTTMIEARVIARRTGGAAGTAEDGAAYIIYGSAKMVGGAATLLTAGTVLDAAVVASPGKVFENEDQAAWDATLDVNGATVRVRVTGAANNNITWHATCFVQEVES